MAVSFKKCDVSSQHLGIPYGHKEISATVTTLTSNQKPRCCVVLTHGAGGDKNHTQLVQICDRLIHQGFLTVRFTCKSLNLGYRVKVFMTVVEHIKQLYHVDKFIVGGRSMGARAAVGMATEAPPLLRETIHGIMCLSYPLYNPDKPSELRDKPLYSVNKPLLFISGTQDKMCDKSSMLAVIEKIQDCDTKVHWIEGEDHGLTDRRTDSMLELCDMVEEWCKERVLPRPGESSNQTSPTNKTGSCTGNGQLVRRKRRQQNETGDGTKRLK